MVLFFVSILFCVVVVVDAGCWMMDDGCVDLHGRSQVQAGHDMQQRGAGAVQPGLEQAATQGRALPSHLPSDDRESSQVSPTLD